MKVPPKRKGNFRKDFVMSRLQLGLNESPSEKEGKYEAEGQYSTGESASMKVPPKRKGNVTKSLAPARKRVASMKVPPKRKGNL